MQVSALACRAAQEWERQTQCKSLQHWIAERRKSGKEKYTPSICSIGLPSGARVGKTNRVQVSAALACRAAQEWERQTECKSLQHCLVERHTNGKDKHSASMFIGLSSGARVGKTNTVQVSALACRAAQGWERQTQFKSLHWLVERRKNGKDKHSASLCSMGLPSGARMGKTNTVQVSALACRAARERNRQRQCKSLHWLAQQCENGKDKHSASLCMGLQSGARVGKTNTVQVSGIGLSNGGVGDIIIGFSLHCSGI